MICFLSYARKDKIQIKNSDDAPYFRSFLDDLRNELIKLTGDAEALFVDDEGIGSGSVWPRVLAEGLRSCRVFAYLHSPFYFSRVDCGKEWGAFWQRMEAAGRVAVAPNQLSPMIPIHWMPIRFIQTKIPPRISEIQYTLSGMDARYAKKGMQHLAKFKDSAGYIKGVERLAEHILDCADKVGLAPAADLPEYASIVPAFAGAASPAAASDKAPAGDPGGPQYARFIFVAAPPDALAEVRSDVAAYRPAGADRWKPFSHEEPDLNAALIAMGAAGQTKLIFQQATVALDPEQFRQQLEQAYRDFTPVVILIDVWTLQLDAYNDVLRKYDDTLFFNCVPFMPWNMKDDETIRAQEKLRVWVQRTFPNLLASGKYKPNLLSITTVEQLRAQMQRDLAELKNTIIRRKQPISLPPGPPIGIPLLPTPGAAGPNG